MEAPQAPNGPDDGAVVSAPSTVPILQRMALFVVMARTVRELLGV